MGEMEELKIVLKDSFSKIKKDMDNLSKKVDELSKENSELSKRIEEQNSENKELKNRISNLENNSNKDNLKEEMMSKLNKNKKKIIKQKILEMIELKHLPIPEVKEFIVDQQNYCSKATFYRYIDDLRKVNKIKDISINNEEYYL